MDGWKVVAAWVAGGSAATYFCGFNVALARISAVQVRYAQPRSRLKLEVRRQKVKSALIGIFSPEQPLPQFIR